MIKGILRPSPNNVGMKKYGFIILHYSVSVGNNNNIGLR